MSASAGRDFSVLIDRLDASEDVRWAVARWLSRRGHHVYLAPLRRAPDRSQWLQFVDDGDIWITQANISEPYQRIEVKGLTTKFTCLEDWPFKGADGVRRGIVCNCGSYDHADPKPAYYLLVNGDRTHIAIVDVGQTRWAWSGRVMGDRHKGRKFRQAYYVCPVHLWDFVEFTNSGAMDGDGTTI